MFICDFFLQDALAGWRSGGFFSRNGSSSGKEQLTYYSEHRIHSLDVLFLLYQDKRNRGFAAYEARQGGVMGFYESKKEVLSTAHAAVANTFEPKSIQTESALALSSYLQIKL